MDSELHRQASDLLARALEVSSAERRAFLEDQTRDRPELRREVLELLDELRTEEGETPSVISTAFTAAGAGTVAGTTIGAYRVVELVGEGGDQLGLPRLGT